MKMAKKSLALAVSLALALPLCRGSAEAKNANTGQSVETAFFYITNSEEQEILVSQLPVSDMAAALENGEIDNTLHNYSVLDNLTTTVHQEAQGFTVPEFVAYAQSKTTAANLKDLALTFQGEDKIAFWELDDTEYDPEDTYTWNQLYGEQRYNFPLLYQYWDYTLQDYGDPEGVMTREQVIDYIFENGEPEIFILSVNAFSQRYILTGEKYEASDYNMEGYWNNQGKLDSERTIRLMSGMTKEDLYNQVHTASDTRFCNQSVLLDMESRPQVEPLEDVAAPTAVMYEGTDGYYYVYLDCATEGASLYYDHNFGDAANSSFKMPTALYDGAIQIPASYLKKDDNGVWTLTLKTRAVKDGCTDAGVVEQKLTSSGSIPGENWENPYPDVSESDWYYDAAAYVTQKGLFEGMDGRFEADTVMSRGMFVTVLGRMLEADVEAYQDNMAFDDVPPGVWFTPSVNWASANGIVTGVGGGRFDPTNGVDLEAVITTLYRQAGEPPVAEIVSLPEGVGPVSYWAEDAMCWAGLNHLLDGVGGTVTAQRNATRAQVAAILMNYDR